MENNLIKESTQKWLSEMYDIPAEDILWYNSGICYSRVLVKTEESANKIYEKVKDYTVNGGWYHGMSLGSYTKTKEGYYDVMC